MSGTKSSALSGEAELEAHIDLKKCTGHARCFVLDPELFDIDDSGYALNPVVGVPAGKKTIAKEAVDACPERAITLR